VRKQLESLHAAKAALERGMDLHDGGEEELRSAHNCAFRSNVNTDSGMVNTHSGIVNT